MKPKAQTIQQAEVCLLRRYAHGRTGDKGDTVNISVIAIAPEYYDHLVEQVTESYCHHVFADRKPGVVTRYLLPNLYAMNFVIDGVLDGGVNRSLYVDRHGKTLSSLLLDSHIAVHPSDAAE